ncbi:hypothetical protein [Ferrovibrio sp.]|uniref:hypothetical protein n=1 Tax=Ferrovibrio sp. TaxID=1917215 RepID=UPI0035B125E9
MSSARGIALACMALLAACQPLPQPFQPDSKVPGEFPLTMPIGEVSLYVAPVTGAEPPLDSDLAARVAAALLAREIPASTATRSLGSSDLTSALIEDENGRLLWAWQVARPRTAPLNGPDYPLGMTAAALNQADERTREALALALASRVAAALDARAGIPAAASSAEAVAALPKVALLPFTGAPGDGNQALAVALREWLLRMGAARVVLNRQEADYLVLCEVKLDDAGPQRQTVSLNWVLQRPDGTRLGDVGQANQVPRGTLDGAWGPVARLAAQGGAEGLRDLLARLGPPLSAKPLN